MISLLLSLALASSAAPAGHAALAASRQALVDCLRQAATTAKPGEVPLDGFAAYAKTRCGNEEAALLDAMIKFDMKNGVSRKSAAEGAQMVLDDYVETAKNKYASRSAN